MRARPAGVEGGKVVVSTKEGGMEGWIYMHLSVLCISPEQYIGCRLESKVTRVIPLDDSGGWDVGFALRGLDGRLHICVSKT